MITCSVCKTEDVEAHPKDKDACVPCANKLFEEMKPDLTKWMTGLSPKEKSLIIKQTVKDFYEKQNRFNKAAAEAAAYVKEAYELKLEAILSDSEEVQPAHQ